MQSARHQARTQERCRQLPPASRQDKDRKKKTPWRFGRFELSRERLTMYDYFTGLLSPTPSARRRVWVLCTGIQWHCSPNNTSNLLPRLQVWTQKSSEYNVNVVRVWALKLNTAWIFQTQHTFKHVFDEGSTQEQVFDRIAFPLVVDLVQGKNGNSVSLYIATPWHWRHRIYGFVCRVVICLWYHQFRQDVHYQWRAWRSWCTP